MNITEIQERLDALAKAMVEKGLKAPEAALVIKSDRVPSALMSWNFSEYECFTCESAAEALTSAEAWVAALPSPEERHRAQFLKLAGAAADYAADHLPGDPIAAEVRATIVAGMQRLSENAIAAE